MKALFKDKPAPGAVLKETEKPAPKETDVLVKVKRASVCGTDLHIYEWDAWAAGRIKTPYIFGHEFAGEVIEMGKNAHFFTEAKVGDLVSAETHVADNKCYQCKTGNKHICENMKLLGVDINGSYAEYVAIPADNVWVNPKEIPLDWMSVQEPMGNAVHTIMACPENISGKKVYIIGAGPIGMCAVAICKAWGATKVFISDVNDYRLDLAKKMGADYMINASKEDVVKFIKEKTNNSGADIILEMSGNGKALNDGLKALRLNGAVSLLGVFGKEVTLNLTQDVVFKAASIKGINGRMMFETWHTVRELLLNKVVDLDKIITHRMKLEKYEKAFELMKNGSSGKILFEF